MRRNKSRGKLGVLFIVAAICLAALGIAYSAWTDTIFIHGTVTTGNVDINIVMLSETYVYKDLDTDGDVVCHKYINKAPLEPGQIGPSEWVIPPIPENNILVASAQTTMTDDDTVEITYTNLFPCRDFMADVELEYQGSIPVKIQLGDWVFDGDEIEIPGECDLQYEDWLEWAYAEGILTTTFFIKDEVGEYTIPVEEGYQLHEGDFLKLVVTIHLPQWLYGVDDDCNIETPPVDVPTDFLMDLSGSFSFNFVVVQWNEYPYDGGGCEEEEPPIGLHADVMLTLDGSGSISGYETELRDAANAFVDAILTPDDGMIGVVVFSTTASLESSFTTDATALHTLIDGPIFPYGWTNLEAAIALSQNELATNDRTPDSGPDPSYPDFMVIITDGEPTAGGDPLDDATAAKAAGTRIFVLGIGDPDPTLLSSIASPGDYYPVADWTDLETALLNLV